MTLQLNVIERSARGKSNASLRTAGTMPAIVYGPKHESQPISMSVVDFEKVFKEAGESTIIVLSGVGEDTEVLIQDVDRDPVTNVVRHADFYAIEAGKTLRLEVPLEYVGEAPVIKIGGVITKVLHEIEIEALPRDLPQHIDVDVSILVDFTSRIHVRDLVLPKGVTIHADPEDIVAVTAEVQEEKEEVPVAIDMDAIEVEKKGKTDEEEVPEATKEKE